MFNKPLILTALVLGGLQLSTAASPLGETSPKLKELGAISPKLSSLGLGLEYKHPITERFVVGAGFYGLPEMELTTMNVDKATASVKGSTSGFLVSGNFYPFANGFHLSGGLGYVSAKGTVGIKLSDKERKKARAEIDATVDPKIAPYKQYLKTAEITRMKDSIIPTNGGITVSYDNAAPYIGIGYDNGHKVEKGLSFAASAGMLFTGSAKLERSKNSFLCQRAKLTRPSSSNSTVNAQLEEVENTVLSKCKEAKVMIDDQIKRAKNWTDSVPFYPVFSLGALYRF